MLSNIRPGQYTIQKQVNPRESRQQKPGFCPSTIRSTADCRGVPGVLGTQAIFSYFIGSRQIEAIGKPAKGEYCC